MNNKETESHRIRAAFICVTVLIFAALDLGLAVFVINWSRFVSVLMFAFLVFFNFSFALLLAKRLLAFAVRPYDLPRLTALSRKPKVAVLYTTMNDVVPESLSSIRQTYPTDVYILDDSTEPEKRTIVDAIAREKDFTVLRREQRHGFKAGAINNWMRTYGQQYDYMVLLDADSYIPPDWIEEALKYAEHRANSKVSIFQGLINIWNLDNKFVRTLAPLHVFGQDIWEKRLANHLDAVFCYGHNALVRMDHLRELGGFVEGYVSEDFATAVKLASYKGYKSRFIPLHTYEAMPENIRGFIKRQNKWTRGSMEFFSFSKQPNLSFLQRLLLFQTPLGHLAYIVILVSMLLTVFGYFSTTVHLLAFAANLLASNILYILSIPLFQYVIVTSMISGVILGVRLYQLGVNSLTYFRYQLLSKAIGAIMLPYEVKTILKYIFNRKLVFTVTPKSERTLSFKETLSISQSTMVLTVLITVGLVLVNPLGIFYNFTWLAPFFVSPLIIYYFSRAASKSKTSASRMMTYTNGGSIIITSTESQSESVNHVLSLYKIQDE